MDESPELQYNRHWRMAVWALRVGYVGLVVAIAGLIVMSSGSTPWVLAVGVIIWLAAAAVTLAGVLLVPARASRATTWVLVDAVHAHPRHGPRPVVWRADLRAPPVAASALRQSPDLPEPPMRSVNRDDEVLHPVEPWMDGLDDA